jgi:hypothetical protein
VSRGEPVLLAIAFALIAILALPPVLVGAEALAWSGDRPGVVAVVEHVAGPICHHDAGRTLVWGGRPLPVCARCTGLYAGAALGGVLGALVGRRQLGPVAPCAPSRMRWSNVAPSRSVFTNRNVSPSPGRTSRRVAPIATSSGTLLYGTSGT